MSSLARIIDLLYLWWYSVGKFMFFMILFVINLYILRLQRMYDIL